MHNLDRSELNRWNRKAKDNLTFSFLLFPAHFELIGQTSLESNPEGTFSFGFVSI